MHFTRLSFAVSFAITASHFTNAAILKRAVCPGGQTVNNEACCPLFSVVDLLQQQLFDGSECGEEAHSALRLSFHDAIGFSTSGGKGGGADGSILAFASDETPLVGNEGIDDITNDQLPIFQQTNISAGDFVHLAAAVGTANCPGAPRLQYMFGRPAPTAAAPSGTIPLPEDNVDTILARFADAGFSPAEMVALLASHTIAAADEVDTTIPGTPFDSTVGTFDSQIYLEVLLKGTQFPGTGGESNPKEVASPIIGEMRLQSDFAISRDNRTSCLWQGMINNQNKMMTEFAAAMAKLQVLGQDTSKLIDCSDVVPTPAALSGDIKYPPTFSQADIEQACPDPFPSIATQAGSAPSLAPVPGS